MPKLTLKAGKETAELQILETDTFQMFQAKVFDLLSIPPKNQKILAKGKMIKEINPLKALPDGTEIKIMGTKAGNQLKKVEVMEIEEDKPNEKFGLQNHEGYCSYITASLQLLKSIPSLFEMVKGLKNSPEQNKMVPSLLMDVFKKVEKNTFYPYHFSKVFLLRTPPIDPKDVEQDPDFFIQRMLYFIKEYGPEQEKYINDTFCVETFETHYNPDIPDEPPRYEREIKKKISSSLSAGQTKMRTNLYEGIGLALQRKAPDFSPIDNRMHYYDSTARFDSLPPYLIVEMGRFIWWIQVHRGDPSKNKRVSRKTFVISDYQENLDLYDYCTEQMKEKLMKGRNIYDQMQKKDQQNFKDEFELFKKTRKGKFPEAQLLEEFKNKKKAQQNSIDQGLQTGKYQLTSFITHTGPSLDKGHSMAWVKETEETWLKFDDTNVYEFPRKKAFQLVGGNQKSEMAYIFLYKQKYVKNE